MEKTFFSSQQLKYMQVFLILFGAGALLSQSLMDGSVVLLMIGFFITAYKTKSFSFLKIASWGIDKLWLVFIPWIFIGLFLNRETSPNWIKYFLEFSWIFFLYGISSLLISLNETIEKNYSQIFKYSFVYFAILSIWAICVYFLRFDPINKLYPTIETEYWRTGGTFGNPMPFAHTYGPALCLFIGICLSLFKDSKKYFYWATGICLTAFVAVMLSYTRGIWVALFLSIPIVFLLYNIRFAIISGILGLSILLGFYYTNDNFHKRIDTIVSQKDNSSQIRKVLWQTNFEIFQDHPIIGVGYTMNKFRLKEYYEKKNLPGDFFEGHAHNQYLQWLAGTGVVGLLCYLIFIGSLLLISIKTYFKEKSIISNNYRFGLLIGVIGAQICFHLGSMTEANFSISKNRFLFMILASIAIYLYKTSPKKQTINN